MLLTLILGIQEKGMVTQWKVAEHCLKIFNAVG